MEDWIEGDSDEEPEVVAPPVDAPTKGPIGRLYPKTQKEIKAGISEIKRRPRPDGVSKEDFEAVESLNIYRFLSGVPHDVESDPELNANSKKAAAACKKHGGLSHDIGDFTNKCNLSGQGDVVRSVMRYMQDSGDNNKERRGHRRWCLNPSMGKTGFGSEGSYSAMWALDSSAGEMMKFWGYPGEGYYPEEYLHGNSWSAYFNKSVPAAEDIDIRVVKLSRRLEKLPIKIDEIPGKEIKVTYQSAFKNTVNFEVEYQGRKKGIYWVEIKGRGLKKKYLVELY